MKTTENTELTATQARDFAKKIAAQCSECFDKVKAEKSFGKWVININGGSAACYGRTLRSIDSAEDTLRIFANDGAEGGAA